MHYIQQYYTHWAALSFLFFGIIWSKDGLANIAVKMLMCVSAAAGAALVFGGH